MSAKAPWSAWRTPGRSTGSAARTAKDFGEVMGETWTSEARAQVGVMIQETIPNRFDWAVQNKAKGQALELIDRYGEVLGEEGTAKAQKRADRL